MGSLTLLCSQIWDRLRVGLRLGNLLPQCLRRRVQQQGSQGLSGQAIGFRDHWPVSCQLLMQQPQMAKPRNFKCWI